jgi:DNA polymerase-3 subunit delta'
MLFPLRFFTALAFIIMTFSEIVGHDRSITILQRALANDMLGHAYLFSGQAGIGKKKTAFALAAAVNCPDARPEGGCGECPSCRKVDTLGHPDVRVLVSDGDEIKIDQIRQVQADLSLKPFEGAKKVLIVDNAESMNVAASNAFLKTLEEPPGNALIILITAMPQGLLSTIRSRCQEIPFHPLPRNVLARALMRQRGLSEEDARFISALAQGSMGLGLEMDLEQEKADRMEVATLLSGLARMGPGDSLALAETLAKDRERFERLIEIGVEWTRDALVYRETGEESLLVHAPGQQHFRQLADGYSLPGLLATMELFMMSQNLLDRRVSTQLVAENLLLKCGRV